MMPSKLRRKSIEECIAFRPGRTFSVRSMDRTQTYLSRLGIFNTINIEASPDTANHNERLLNVDIFCKFDAPLEMSLEANASSKSNSYIGPGLVFGVTNKNIFGGGEQLSVKLSGTYEWQTGHGRNSVFNSYEVGGQQLIHILRRHALPSSHGSGTKPLHTGGAFKSTKPLPWLTPAPACIRV